MCKQLETNASSRSSVPARSIRPVRAVSAPGPAFARPGKRPAPVPAYRTNAHVLDLVRRFEETTLPEDEWTHEAHLIVALAYARRARPEKAIARLRTAIKRYNAATGTPETETRGYHETITLAWFHLVRHFLDVFDDGLSLAALADAVVELYSSKTTLFEHYTRERLLSLEARRGWVEPDLRALPELETLTREDKAWLQALEARTTQVLAVNDARAVAEARVLASREVALSA